ncbi:MAG: hypothetical protein FWG78_02655 [Coriobacteriia bacterium]|nr:hypothetical protein [Coriobacteriia bacterium]
MSTTGNPNTAADSDTTAATGTASGAATAAGSQTDLIERYLYAVTRYLPRKDRDEVKRELDSLIADMLETRCGATPATEKDVRVVLTELGTPQEMAEQYDPSSSRALISGLYFVLYKRVLTLVLPIVALALAFAIILSFIFDSSATSANPYAYMSTMFGQVLGGTLSGVFQAFAIITLIFAILEWRQVDLRGDDIAAGIGVGDDIVVGVGRIVDQIEDFAKDPLNNLPPVPKTNEIKPWEPIFGIVMSMLFLTVFLGFPQIIGVGLFDTGFEGEGWIPLFNVELIRAAWIPITIWAVLGVAKEARKLIDGRYTKRLAANTCVLNVVIAACAIFVFSYGDIINPEFIAYIVNLFAEADAPPIIGLVFANFNLVFLGIVLIALVADSVGTVTHAFTASTDA